MFIEIHRDGKRRLVNVAWISGVSETSGCIDIGDGEEWVSCDESYDEIVWKIAEGERVVAEEEQKDWEEEQKDWEEEQKDWEEGPHWSDRLSELRKREAEKLMEELLDDK